MNHVNKLPIILLALIIIVPIALAHGQEHRDSEIASLPDPVQILYYSGFVMAIAVLSGIFYKLGKTGKKIVFAVICISVVFATAYLAGHTVYLNVVSETGGPVHWHADYEVWVCDKKLDLIDPEGFENRIGSSSIHEHGDDRIHIEGVLVKKSQASLESYFHIIGGELAKDELSYPAHEGSVSVKNGDSCNGNPGKVQVFVYKTHGNLYKQEKIEEFPEYILSPHSQVPPGDCIIIEFGQEKEKTDKICDTYQVAVSKGDLIEG